MNILFKIFGGSYDDLWKAIIRPNKDTYKIEELGPFKFELKGKCYKRTDFELINKRSQKIMCSFWEPFDEERESPRLPCVIYLHGNSSSRCEAYPEVKYLLQRNITVFALDFCGCGKSEGEYITLGYNEKKDVHCVVEYLLKSRKVSKIGLWGRSMGAVTAIMYANEHPKLIDVMILDSGFYSLKKLISELIESKINLPKFIYDKVLNMVKETVREKANFDLDIIEPYIYAKNCLVPAFFCHGSDDNFVLPHHCVDLFNDYKGTDKCCEIVKGFHNSSRPKELRLKICDFLMKYLKEDDLDSNGTINNSNTYERIGINNFNNILRLENNKDMIKNLNKSLNIIDIKSKVVQKTSNKNKSQLNNYKQFLDGINENELNPTNNINFSINENKNNRTYSQNKYTKNSINIINKKNTTYNIINNNLKIKELNNKIQKNEENISSSSSSNLEEKLPIYKKKNVPKEKVNCIKIKTFSITKYFNNTNNINKNKVNIGKYPIINKKINVINLNKNKKTNNKKTDSNISHSFLAHVIRNNPQIKNNKNITVYNNSFLKNNIIRNSPQTNKNKNINNGERTFTEKFFIPKKNRNLDIINESTNNNTNIIQNNFYTTNNIYLNNKLPVKTKKTEQNCNFSYSSKKPFDKYIFKANDKNKKITKNEIKKNILFKSYDINKDKTIDILNKNKNKNNIVDINKNKNIKLNSKRSVHSTENTIINENDETIGKNFFY